MKKIIDKIKNINMKELVIEVIKGGFYLIFMFLAMAYIRSNYYDIMTASTGSMGATVNEEGRYILDRTQKDILSIDRFDVIVMDAPSDRLRGTYYVKRVIGIPGDIITIDDQENLVITRPKSYYNRNAKTDTVYKIALEPYLKETKEAFVKKRGDKYVFNNEYSLSDFNSKNGHFKVLQANEYWVMGDDRPGSNDSRTFGPIHINTVKGKVVAQVWPLEKFHLFPQYELNEDSTITEKK